MATAFWTMPKVFAAAIALRLGLLLYGLVQDAYSPLKYTDIDYFVFTDAARYVAHGDSPYQRETYRYTPLLAWMLVPTAWNGFGFVIDSVFFSFGKILFSVADLVAGWLLVLLLKDPGENGKRFGMSEERALKFASIWLLNPMVATISTRGSSEGLLGAMVAALLWSVLHGHIALAGALLGLGVHFKIYPFVYAPSLLLFLESPPSTTLPSPPEKPGRRPESLIAMYFHALKSACNKDRISLTVVSLATFGVLNLWMYLQYGHPFLQHTYFHHLTRIDHRHNFSPYNTLLYASSAASASASPTSLSLLSFTNGALRLESLAFVPQLGLSAVLIPIALAKRHLPGAMLAQTWAFVALNKVCTSQYFLWYLILLPLYLPYSSLVTPPYYKGIAALGLWIAAQVLWLQQGFQLEFLGRSTFVPGLWLAGMAFYLVNMWILSIIVDDVGHLGPKGKGLIKGQQRRSKQM